MLQGLKNRQICIIFGLLIILIGLFVAYHALDVRGQQTGINTLFITLTNGEQGRSYDLYLKDNTSTKDRLSVTLDAANANINYFPPLGVTINVDDFLCTTDTNRCSQIPAPDPFGTSTVTLSLR